MRQVADLRRMIGSAKAHGGTFSTNLFLTDAALEPAARAGTLLASESPGAVIFLSQGPLFGRLYYAAAGSDYLVAALHRLKLPQTGAFVVDLIGRRSKIAPWVSAFEEAGFSRYSTLIRLQRLFSQRPPTTDRDHNVETAQEQDAESIQTALAVNFDPYADQLPPLEEIGQAATRGTILLIRDAGRIAALLYYDRRGITTAFRYWLVLPDYRTQGFSDMLIRRYFQDCAGCRRSVLWVHESNSRAILIDKWYGYRPDSIVDVVLIKR
jgi:GNAT superfamily N-acetyltransferase